MTRTKFAAIAVAAVAVVTVLLVAGVVWLAGDDETSTPDGGTDAGFSFDPIGADPTSVAVTVMAGLYTWQPSVQDSTWEALHAQRERLTAGMAVAARTPPDPAPRPLPEWEAWARSGDTLTAVVRAAGDARVDGAAATVPVTIAQTVQHSSGDATPYTTYTASVTLTEAAGTWRVSNYRLAAPAN